MKSFNEADRKIESAPLCICEEMEYNTIYKVYDPEGVPFL